MQPQYPTAPTDVQASPDMAQYLASQLEAFLQPLLLWLDTTLDKRLVRTFLHTVQAILQFRHRAHGLLLSELGAYLLSPAHAPTGTKRLSNLLHSPRWAASLIEQFLWNQADARLTALEEAGGDALVVWDESVLEKPKASPWRGCVRSVPRKRRGSNASSQATLIRLEAGPSVCRGCTGLLSSCSVPKVRLRWR